MATPILERLRGVRRETDATQPFVMDDAERVHLVERGSLDVFAVELAGERPVGRRQFVTRVAAGEMALGAGRVAYPARPERVFGFLAVPGLDTVVIDGERAGVAGGEFDLDAVAWIDAWVASLSEFAVRGCPPPRDAVQVEAEPGVTRGARNLRRNVARNARIWLLSIPTRARGNGRARAPVGLWEIPTRAREGRGERATDRRRSTRDAGRP